MRNFTPSLDFGNRTELIEKIKSLIGEYSDLIDRVVLFGSTARNEFTDKSDIDLYIESLSYKSNDLLRKSKFGEFVLRLYDIANNEIEFDLLAYGFNELSDVRESMFYQFVETDDVILYDKGAEII